MFPITWLYGMKDYDKTLYYKVVGEILTQGIKEGTEFDENTIKYLTIK